MGFTSNLRCIDYYIEFFVVHHVGASHVMWDRMSVKVKAVTVSGVAAGSGCRSSHRSISRDRV